MIIITAGATSSATTARYLVDPFAMTAGSSVDTKRGPVSPFTRRFRPSRVALNS